VKNLPKAAGRSNRLLSWTDSHRRLKQGDILSIKNARRRREIAQSADQLMAPQRKLARHREDLHHVAQAAAQFPSEEELADWGEL